MKKIIAVISFLLIISLLFVACNAATTPAEVEKKESNENVVENVDVNVEQNENETQTTSKEEKEESKSPTKKDVIANAEVKDVEEGYSYLITEDVYKNYEIKHSERMTKEEYDNFDKSLEINGESVFVFHSYDKDLDETFYDYYHVYGHSTNLAIGDCNKYRIGINRLTGRIVWAEYYVTGLIHEWYFDNLLKETTDFEECEEHYPLSYVVFSEGTREYFATTDGRLYYGEDGKLYRSTSDIDFPTIFAIASIYVKSYPKVFMELCIEDGHELYAEKYARVYYKNEYVDLTREELIPFTNEYEYTDYKTTINAPIADVYDDDIIIETRLKENDSITTIFIVHSNGNVVFKNDNGVEFLLYEAKRATLNCQFGITFINAVDYASLVKIFE